MPSWHSWQRIDFGDATASFCPASLTFELQRRLIVRCLSHIDPTYTPRGSAVARIVTALADGRSASLGPILAKSIRSPGREAR